jgi:hypothetical protein
MSKFEWLKTYTSPFKAILPKLYLGKIAIGTPYFYPRRWVKSETKGFQKAIPRKIGFDFVGLGWKTKWEETDYRYEWSPIWSFVFFKWQIALIFVPKDRDAYWTCWLYYHRNTDRSKSQKKRIEQARKEYPCVWRVSQTGRETMEVCYWDKILK